jgi:hypothetical protein
MDLVFLFLTVPDILSGAIYYFSRHPTLTGRCFRETEIKKPPLRTTLRSAHIIHTISYTLSAINQPPLDLTHPHLLSSCHL